MSFKKKALVSIKTGVKLIEVILHSVDNFFRSLLVLFFLWITRLLLHRFYTVIHNSKSTFQGLIQHVQGMVQFSRLVAQF